MSTTPKMDKQLRGCKKYNILSNIYPWPVLDHIYELISYKFSLGNLA